MTERRGAGGRKPGRPAARGGKPGRPGAAGGGKAGHTGGGKPGRPRAEAGAKKGRRRKSKAGSPHRNGREPRDEKSAPRGEAAARAAAESPLPEPLVQDIDYRAGFVALLGPPNAGKSTLLNRILAEKLAIVTAKPQTTRSRITGIHARPRAQMIFVDTPGLHESEKPLGAALNESVGEAASACDVALLLVDLTRGWDEAHDQIQAMLKEANTPYFVVGTKADLPGADRCVWPPPAAGASEACVRISSRSGDGIEPLLQQVERALPVSAPLYPEDELTDRPVRWLAGELVREALFEELGQELPYHMAVEVVKFDESRKDMVSIRANLLVQRDSQKRIVIGKGGAQIREIGIRARKQIEQLVGTKVHLDLWVKIDPKWLKDRDRIEELGYR